MKLDVTKKLKDLDDKVLKEDKKDIVLKKILTNALLIAVEKESGVDKVKKYELAKLIHKGKVIDLTAEDVVLLKKQVGDFYTPLVVGQVFALLEGKEKESDGNK